jgi:hypothetical protein
LPTGASVIKNSAANAGFLIYAEILFFMFAVNNRAERVR